MRSILGVDVAVCSRSLLFGMVLPVVLATPRGTRAQEIYDTAYARQCTRATASNCAATNVSLVRLLAAPEQFDGKRVKVIGFVHLEFEGDHIYLHREDFERGLMPNGFPLGFRPDVYKRGKSFNDRYVLMEGTFRAAYGGGITDIWSATVWPSRGADSHGSRGFQVLKGRPAPR